ncbi:MAG: SAM-dependent methyltransferase [Chloroflexi bacterium]|nr:MAG: SAM-dependent methyltransferase [Chloroflexota bacterium]
MSVPAEQEHDHKQRVRAQFGAHAQGYVESVRHRTGPDLQRLVELAEPTPQSIALDIATGGGHTALALSSAVGSVVASDLTPEMLNAAETFIRGQGVENVTFEIAEAEQLPFADASFDIVSCRIAPHHFVDPRAYVREVARVLRPGGRFVMMDSTPVGDGELDEFINRVEHWRDPTHVRSYTEAEWRSWMEAAGLTVDHWEANHRVFEFRDWAARAGMDPQERDRLEQYMLNAPERVRSAYEITYNQDGSISTFLDNKFILRARKPGKAS